MEDVPALFEGVWGYASIHCQVSHRQKIIEDINSQISAGHRWANKCHRLMPVGFIVNKTNFLTSYDKNQGFMFAFTSAGYESGSKLFTCCRALSIFSLFICKCISMLRLGKKVNMKQKITSIVL